MNATLPVRLLPWALTRWSYRRARSVTWRGFDALLGVRTTPLSSDGPLEEYGKTYPFDLPSGWLLLWRVMRRLRPTAGDAMLDIGCGSGRAALVASLFSFRRVIGVELEDGPLRAAQANRQSFRSPSRDKIEFVGADASTMPIPDDVTVVFFYNAFRGELFDRMLANIGHSLNRAPRRLRLVYGNPFEHQRLMATGQWTLAQRFGGFRPGADWARMVATHVYEARLDRIVTDQARCPASP